MERLNTSGFLFTQTTVEMTVAKADFGDGYGAGALIGDPDGLRTWAMKIDALPDSTTQAPSIGGKSRALYLWDFFIASKAAGNAVFEFEDPMDPSGATILYAEFADDILTFEILCSKVYSTGLSLRQRRIGASTLPAPTDLTGTWITAPHAPRALEAEQL